MWPCRGLYEALAVGVVLIWGFAGDGNPASRGVRHGRTRTDRLHHRHPDRRGHRAARVQEVTGPGGRGDLCGGERAADWHEVRGAGRPAALPQGRLAVLPGSHLLPAEAPGVVNALLLWFLAGAAPATRWT
jgi:hypothetical protein